MNKKAILFNAAIVGLFSASVFAQADKAAPAPAGDAKPATVKCKGINSCKGSSACKGNSSDGAGLNSCAGKGFVNVSAAECKEKKGTVL